MQDRPTERKRQRGFTLMELGVVVGVIGILFTTVMMIGGYARGARITAGVQMISTLESAARSWSTRFTNRTGYRTQSGTPISIASLEAAGLIDTGMQSPWGTAPTIAPEATNNENLVIRIETSDAEGALDLSRSLGGLPKAVPSGRWVTFFTN